MTNIPLVQTQVIHRDSNISVNDLQVKGSFVHLTFILIHLSSLIDVYLISIFLQIFVSAQASYRSQACAKNNLADEVAIHVK